MTDATRQEQILNLKDEERQALERHLKELARSLSLSLSSLTDPVYILRDSAGKDHGPMSLFEVEESLNELRVIREFAEQHNHQVGGCFSDKEEQE